MKAIVTGVGAWGPGFSNLEEFKILLDSGALTPADDLPPKPERIPTRERRRAPLMVKLAIEVADQACKMASQDPATAQSVFTSGIGDAQITDYMCRVLAGKDKLLSPTKFHNSVHNAAAGYWSISTGCEKPATFVSGMQNSFSMALIEAMIQVTSDNVPVLLVSTDLAMPEPLRAMHPIERMLGVAILLSPDSTTPSCSSLTRPLSLSLQSAETAVQTWPMLEMAHLDELYACSPAAKSLCLLKALCSDSLWYETLPVSAGLVADIAIDSPCAALPVSSHYRGSCNESM